MDDVHINLGNVKWLVFLAESYKVYRLADLCFDYLRTEIRGESVLTVLEVLRALLGKAIMCLWKDFVTKNKLMQRFQELNLAERRDAMQELVAASKTLSKSSRANSRAGSRKGSFSSMATSDAEDAISYATGRSVYLTMDEINEDVLMTLELGDETSNKLRQKSQQLFYQLVALSEELSTKCWTCVAHNTDMVITSVPWVSQPLDVVQAVLRLDVCNVPEIALFRALMEWTDKRCQTERLALLPENRLKVMQRDTLLLIRFPCMSLQQIQWEVVPAGVLDYEEVDQLQGTLSSRKPNFGKFNPEPRQYPISSMLRAKIEKKDMKDKETQGVRVPRDDHTWTVTVQDVDNKSLDKHLATLRLPAKSPVYEPKPGDVIDAMLASHLLRGHVDRFVEDYATSLLAVEADTPSSKEERTRATLLCDPADLSKRDSKGNDQAAAKELKGMLMLSQNWLAEDVNDDKTMPSAEIQQLARPSSRASQREVGFSSWGEPPAPQDFKRLAHGIYCFRGNRILELVIENGEVVVYEIENDIDDGDVFAFVDEDLDNFSDEAVRKELGLTNIDEPRTKVPLSTFLSRQ
jgi:hypothetical protein